MSSRALSGPNSRLAWPGSPPRDVAADAVPVSDRPAEAPAAGAPRTHRPRAGSWALSASVVATGAVTASPSGMAPMNRRLAAERVDRVDIERHTTRPDTQRDQAADGELRAQRRPPAASQPPAAPAPPRRRPTPTRRCRPTRPGAARPPTPATPAPAPCPARPPRAPAPAAPAPDPAPTPEPTPAPAPAPAPRERSRAEHPRQEIGTGSTAARPRSERT